jgi:uncharacterized protein (TIGR02246 family)
MKKLIIILSVVVFAGCKEQKKVDKKAEGDKVIQSSKDWAKAALAGDVEKIISYWTEDAILISAGQPVLDGKPAIKKMVEDGYKMPGFRISWQPQQVEVSESGDLAYLIENSQISFADSTGKLITLNNKGVTIWRKQKDGSWKNAVDISTPASPSEK